MTSHLQETCGSSSRTCLISISSFERPRWLPEAASSPSQATLLSWQGSVFISLIMSPLLQSSTYGGEARKCLVLVKENFVTWEPVVPATIYQQLMLFLNSNKFV